MVLLQQRLRGAAILVFVVAGSCGVRPARMFQVVPNQQGYLLRAPDRRETPFSGILSDYNGFVRGKSWIDLRPRMELRIENAYYQPGMSRRGLDGYLGTEVARYEVRSDGLRLESAEPMKERPAGDVAARDLVSSRVAHERYYRLYYEVFNRATNTRVSVLLGANSRQQLEMLSAEMEHPETLCGRGSAQCTSFPEACSVSVEMKVVVNGKIQSVLWGSQLPSVLGAQVRHVQLRRLYLGRLTPVKIDAGDAGLCKCRCCRETRLRGIKKFCK